jgi:hypothetical protein
MNGSRQAQAMSRLAWKIRKRRDEALRDLLRFLLDEERAPERSEQVTMLAAHYLPNYRKRAKKRRQRLMNSSQAMD